MTPLQEAERKLVAALFLDPEIAPDIESILQPTDLTDKRLGHLVSVVFSLADKPEPVEMVAITDLLRSQGKLDWVGTTLMGELIAEGISTSHASHHATLIKRGSTLRAVVRVCHETIEEASAVSATSESAVAALTASLEASAFSVSSSSLGGSSGGSIDEALRALLTDLDKPQESRATSWTFALNGMDRHLQGMRGGEFMVLAARPSIGKTTLALNITTNLCKAGAKCLFVSMEMSTDQLVQRLLSRISGIPGHNFRSNTFTEQDREHLFERAQMMGQWGLQLIEDFGTTPGRLASMSRRASSVMGGLDFIVLDYLQLMSDPETAKHGRVQEVSAISRQLKSIARELNVGVIALSQLSRAGAEGVPGLHHLRESGSIEQDADQVAFLYVKDGEVAGDEIHGVIAKNRHGSTGEFALAFDRPRFYMTDASFEMETIN